MDKITEQDLANRGVKGLPDVPGLTTEEMQRKLEEIAREILIPKVNELVEGLNNANSNLTQQNYELKELVYASGVAKFNEQDGAVQFVYKNGISRICGLIEVTTESPSRLFTSPIAPKKQHWFTITSTSNGKSYTCLLSAVNGVALYWGSEHIPVGIYVIDTTF